MKKEKMAIKNAGNEKCLDNRILMWKSQAFKGLPQTNGITWVILSTKIIQKTGQNTLLR